MFNLFVEFNTTKVIFLISVGELLDNLDGKVKGNSDSTEVNNNNKYDDGKKILLKNNFMSECELSLVKETFQTSDVITKGKPIDIIAVGVEEANLDNLESVNVNNNIKSDYEKEGIGEKVSSYQNVSFHQYIISKNFLFSNLNS